MITIDNGEHINAGLKILDQQFAAAANAILWDSVPESITEDIDQIPLSTPLTVSKENSPSD